MTEQELIAMNEIDKDALIHHGIKGQKWGVQNGPPYPLSVQNTTRNSDKEVNEIVSSMSKLDLEKLNLYEDYNHQHLIKRIVKKVNNIPVSFCDISNEDGFFNVSFATRAGGQYRRKGYANECISSIVDWWEKNRRKYPDKKLSWWVLRDNIGSVKLAENNGFVLNEADSDRYQKWYHYEL